MATLPKTKAKLIAKKGNTYEFEEISTRKHFLAPIEQFHKFVEYPPSLLNINSGELTIGSSIDIVIKTTENGTVTYYPDVTSYQKKVESAPISPEELATCILNLIDHIDEIEKEQERKIVKALSLHDDKLACFLIRKALLLE